MKKEQIKDVSDDCPNAYVEVKDLRICNGNTDSSRLFCMDASPTDSNFTMEYLTSNKVAYGFGFYAHFGLCKLNKFL